MGHGGQGQGQAQPQSLLAQPPPRAVDGLLGLPSVPPASGPLLCTTQGPGRLGCVPVALTASGRCSRPVLPTPSTQRPPRDISGLPSEGWAGCPPWRDVSSPPLSAECLVRGACSPPAPFFRAGSPYLVAVGSRAPVRAAGRCGLSTTCSEQNCVLTSLPASPMPVARAL